MCGIHGLRLLYHVVYFIVGGKFYERGVVVPVTNGVEINEWL
jgi:hypothetical protein